MGVPEYYNYDNNNNNNQAYNYLLVNVNHWYVDEYMKPRTNEQRLPEDDKYHQLGKLRENNCYEKDLIQENYHCNPSPISPFMNVVSMDEKVMGTQWTKIPFHIASIPKPQDEYNIVVNNMNQPFEHVWLQRSKDGSRYIHPLEKFTVNDFVDKDVSKFEPVIPPPVDGTPFKFVQEVQELEELVHKLRNATEFAPTSQSSPIEESTESTQSGPESRGLHGDCSQQRSNRRNTRVQSARSGALGNNSRNVKIRNQKEGSKTILRVCESNSESCFNLMLYSRFPASFIDRAELLFSTETPVYM